MSKKKSKLKKSDLASLKKHRGFIPQFKPLTDKELEAVETIRQIFSVVTGKKVSVRQSKDNSRIAILEAK
jgi:ribosomal protein L39E